MRAITFAAGAIFACTNAVQLTSIEKDIDDLLPEYLKLSAEIALKLSEIEDVAEPEVCKDDECVADLDLDLEIPDDFEEVDFDDFDFDFDACADGNCFCKDGECFNFGDDCEDGSCALAWDDVPDMPEIDIPDSCCGLEEDDDDCGCSGAGALGVLVQKVDDVISMTIPDTCEDCTLKIDLDLEGGLLEFTQVPDNKDDDSDDE